MVHARLTSQERRASLATPYAKEHERSLNRRMETGVMPKDLPGLLRWYEAQWSMETPDRLHVHSVWRDFVTQHEAAISGRFRLRCAGLFRALPQAAGEQPIGDRPGRLLHAPAGLGAGPYRA